MSADPSELLSTLELTEYEEQALETLLMLGQTSAPDLSEATGIPKARIYGVLDSLADDGYIKIIPGRPKMYQPKPPSDILDRAIESRRQQFETYQHDLQEIRDDFVDTLQPLYESASEEVTPTEELFYVVDVGDPSEEETRRLYRDADTHIDIITKSFEYLEAVEPTLERALADGCTIRILFLDPSHLSETNQRIQCEVVEHIHESYPGIETRFSQNPLPWRGTIIDPSMDYDHGSAIMLVEEENIPLHKRQAAVTDNASFVAGLERYFNLIWTHESQPHYPPAEDA
ncbi:helix-turn-helix domain-containing protein [Halobacterium salinarum]|uniref:TrmB family transcriptional regulator n=1 Tax=Halobacterium salinarum TaxID=2242 RepID=UPI0025552BC6|nr:helix-turn-helix domain-containing protein [Halobacterium salinarum]MDL0132054.1 helix-turn-helix domain-containing protein [Halobacterium salinarum]